MESVKKTVKNWMKDGFVMVELKHQGGFGNLYSAVDDAIASVENFNDFILYNPTPCDPNRHWMALEVKHNDYGSNWTADRFRGDGKGKKTRKVMTDLLANYDALIAGTYTYVKPVKRKKTIPQISLQEFFISQGLTKENWEKSTHRYTHDVDKYLKDKTEEEKKAYEELFSIDEINYTFSISKKAMMSAVKYKYMSLFASYWSNLYCGSTLWYEDEQGNAEDVAWPTYENEKPVLRYTNLKYVKGSRFKGCYGRFESVEESIFEYDWEDLANYMVDKEGLSLTEEGTLIIYDHNCSNGDECLKDLMCQLDAA